MVGQGATQVASTPIQFVDVAAGKTQTQDLGGSGAVVTGQLTPPKGMEKIDWRPAAVDIEPHVLQIPPPLVPGPILNPQKRELWMFQWRQTPEGQNWSLMHAQMKQRKLQGIQFYATVDNDGSFHIDDVPAGNYKLRASVQGVPAAAWSQPLEVNENPKNGVHDMGKILPSEQ